jgi:predicted NBD/HSP70 family sugar kinase
MLMKASTENLRKQNRGLILSALRRLGSVSHTELSQWTSLSSATVSTITTELEKEGILLRDEQTPSSGRGRPRVKFRQNPNCAFIAIVRITSELVQYSLVDYAGTLKDRFEEKRPPAETDIDTFSVRLKHDIERLIQRNELQPEQILTVSITTKGLVASGKPELLWSPVYEDTKLNFEDLLKPILPAQIRLTNDTQFAAQSIAEKHAAKLGGFSNRKLATLSLSHSIGLGIATEEANGKISSFAPPFGHMMHDPNGPLCRCGAHGCIESIAGFYGILRTAFEVDDNVVPAKFIPLKEIENIAVRARNGDHRTEYAFRSAGEALGIGLGRLLTLLGPMPIAITGHGTLFYDLMQKSILEGIQNTLQVRRNKMPEVSFHTDEGELIFNGNMQSCLSDLDSNIISEQNGTKWKFN